MEKYDYSAFVEEPTESDLETLRRLVREACELDQVVEDAEETLKRLTKLRDNVRDKLIPELMEKNKLKHFKTDDDIEVTIAPKITAKIRSGSEREAARWLESQGMGSVVKDQFTIQFGRSEVERANQLGNELDQMGVYFDRKSSVHPSTLKKTMSDLMEDGVKPPDNLFNVHRYHTAKIKVK